jgi:hypothetical protein
VKLPIVVEGAEEPVLLLLMLPVDASVSGVPK